VSEGARESEKGREVGMEIMWMGVKDGWMEGGREGESRDGEKKERGAAEKREKKRAVAAKKETKRNKMRGKKGG
jgi:hypothetical protein